LETVKERRGKNLFKYSDCRAVYAHAIYLRTDVKGVVRLENSEENPSFE
jgi:hypothetical protein